MDAPLLSLEDAAKLLGYTPSGLRKIVRRTREGKRGPTIQFFQVGTGPIRFKPEWLDEFVAANSTMPQRQRSTPIPKAVRCKNRSTVSNGHGTLAEYFP
jgi:hypothetical protein